MKKILLIGFLLLTLTGCAGRGLLMDSRDVDMKVKGWIVYTNPAYRYELRVPSDWTWKSTGEDGYQVGFFPTANKDAFEKYPGYWGGVVIRSYSNWQTKSTLEQFYSSQSVNVWTEPKEEITFGGEKAYWFKSVKGLSPADPEQAVQLIVVNRADSIVEIIISEDMDITKTMANSIKFYGNQVKGNLY